MVLGIVICYSISCYSALFTSILIAPNEKKEKKKLLISLEVGPVGSHSLAITTSAPFDYLLQLNCGANRRITCWRLPNRIRPAFIIADENILFVFCLLHLDSTLVHGFTKVVKQSVKMRLHHSFIHYTVFLLQLGKQFQRGLFYEAIITKEGSHGHKDLKKEKEKLGKSLRQESARLWPSCAILLRWGSAERKEKEKNRSTKITCFYIRHEVPQGASYTVPDGWCSRSNIKLFLFFLFFAAAYARGPINNLSRWQIL